MHWQRIPLIALIATSALAVEVPAQIRVGNYRGFRIGGVRLTPRRGISARSSGMRMAQQYLRNQSKVQAAQIQAQQKLLAQQQEARRLAEQKKQQQRQAAADAARAAKERERERAKARAKAAGTSGSSTEKSSDASADETKPDSANATTSSDS